MTSTTPSSADIAPANAEELTTDNTVANDDAPVSLSSFIADALRAKMDKQPWYQTANKANHDQRPGRPPHGTRRSMGKR